MADKPFAAGQRVRCRYDTDEGNLITGRGIVHRVTRLGLPVNGNQWRVEVNDLPGRSGTVHFFLPTLHANAIEAASFPPLSMNAMRKLARQARKFGHYRDGVKVSLDCPRCMHRVNLTFSQYEGTLTKQLDAAVIRHLSDDETCTPPKGRIG